MHRRFSLERDPPTSQLSAEVPSSFSIPTAGAQAFVEVLRGNAKRPPGNRAAFYLGRIAPTEAKPSELSGCILSLAKTGVKAKSEHLQLIENK